MYANVLFTLVFLLKFSMVFLSPFTFVYESHTDIFSILFLLYTEVWFVPWTHHYALPFPDPPSSAQLGELKRKEEQSGRSIQNT